MKEKQWPYLTHCKLDKEVHAFAKSVSPIINIKRDWGSNSFTMG